MDARRADGRGRRSREPGARQPVPSGGSMMTATTLRTMIVGCGAAAQQLYRKPLQRLERQGAVRVTGLVDRHGPHAEALRRSFPAATVYDDLELALQAGGADLALILTPVQLHADQSVLALRHGAHVLCEKPMATTAGQCDAMLRAAEKAGQVLAVGM